MSSSSPENLSRLCLQDIGESSPKAELPLVRAFLGLLVDGAQRTDGVPDKLVNPSASYEGIQSGGLAGFHRANWLHPLGKLGSL
jgi:hypothetical protein